MAMRKGFPLVAVLLIIVGAVMLLDKTRVVYFGWSLIFWLVITVLGGYKVYYGFRFPLAGRIFWGTVFFLVGLYNVLWEIGMLELPGGMLLPAFLAVAGLGFLLAFIRQPKEWHLAVPAIALLGVGFLMIFVELEYVGRWVVTDTIKQWWPVALILFGGSLLLNKGIGRRQSLQ
jgi:hypothetical protein